MSLLKTTLKWIHRLEDGLLSLLLTGMIGLSGLQIILRNGFDSGLHWADPLLRIMVLWLGLLGAMVASRDKRHISIDVFSRLITGRLRHVVQLASDSFTATVSAFIAWYGLAFVRLELIDKATVLDDIPAWPFEAIIPFVFGVIACRYAIHALLALNAVIRNDPIREIST